MIGGGWDDGGAGRGGRGCEGEVRARSELRGGRWPRPLLPRGRRAAGPEGPLGPELRGCACPGSPSRSGLRREAAQRFPPAVGCRRATASPGARPLCLRQGHGGGGRSYAAAGGVWAEALPVPPRRRAQALGLAAGGGGAGHEDAGEVGAAPGPPPPPGSRLGSGCLHPAVLLAAGGPRPAGFHSWAAVMWHSCGCSSSDWALVQVAGASLARYSPFSASSPYFVDSGI